MLKSLPVLNLADAKYECIFGRGCDGICCQNGRPGVYPEEKETIDANLDKFLPLLRPEARKVIEKQGYLSNRVKDGLPMLRVSAGWCVFFNEGCVFHKVGAAEGDNYKYKPCACALFPLTKDEKDRWYIRQHGYKGEAWDLFCLAPDASPKLAAETMQTEIALALRFTQEAEAAKAKG
jgi:hypothetical protein